MDNESVSVNDEQSVESDSQGDQTYETVTYDGPDYTDQLQTLIYQQQLSICFSGLLLGVLISVSIINILKRFF